MGYASLIVLALAAIAVIGFAQGANRAVNSLIEDFRMQRREAVEAAVALQARASSVTALDYGTWDEMYAFVDEPDPAWIPFNLGWIVESLGFSSVAVLDLQGAIVHEQGDTLVWPPELRDEVAHYFVSALAEDRQATTLVYVPGAQALYWLSGVQIVPSDGPSEARGHSGYLVVGDVFSSEDMSHIESVTGVVDLHPCVDSPARAGSPHACRSWDSGLGHAGAGDSVPAAKVSAGPTRQSRAPDSSGLLTDTLSVGRYIGPPGMVLHYESVLPLAGEQIAAWRSGSATSVAAIIAAITACFVISHRTFVGPFLKLTRAVETLAGSGTWAAPPTRYREFAAVADAVGRAIDSRLEAEAALRQAQAGLEVQVAERTAQLGAANGALAESEQRYRGIVEDLPVLLCRFSPDRRLTFVNRAYADYFQRSPTDLLGTDFLEFVPEPDHLAVLEALAGLDRERPMGTYEHRVVAGGGKVRWQRWTDRAILDGDRRVVGYQSFGQDITEQRELEDRLRQSQKMETVGRLAGGIAHDFNNILTAIMAHTSFAMDGVVEECATREDMREVMKSAERARNLTSQLLAFSRRQILEPKPINFSELVMEADRMLRRLIGEHIELVTLPSRDIFLTKADRGQMEQILVNLAVNARDAMPDGGVLTIETGCAFLDKGFMGRDADIEPGRFAMLAVSDTGIGMGEEVKSHLFEPFFTTKEVGKGTGLGLATVYGIVKQHGGTIWVYSEPGKGSTFKVYLLVAEEETVTHSTQVAKEAAAKGREVVLLAEDEAAVRAVSGRMLQRLGYTVLRASNGEEATHLARRYPDEIDLLVTDVVMPQMGGTELANQLRKERPLLKVLYVSGYTDNDIHHHGVLDPNIDFLQKPFTETALANKIRAVLDKPVFSVQAV